LVLNFRGATHWFHDPLSARQLASWALLSLSLLPLGLGVHLLRRLGQADAQARRDPRLFRIEQTTRLVTTGVYRYIRHPIYTSLLLLTWGAFFKAPSWVAALLAAGASLLLLATAVTEERENVQYWGASYEAYRRDTKRFIPFLC
jgi:protein-S-isoprenylcysteine O-methyltransferase Ste14